jgi:predicted ArsR family transcriptional regulator
MERFPTRYMQLTTRLLTQMKETMPAPVVTKLFSKIADDIASQYSNDIKGLNIEERLDFVKEMLGHEGFTVEWEKKDGQYQIHEISCPYYQIGVAHPEVCTVDQTLISKMLALPANKVQCILSGAAHCTYVIQTSKIKN